MKITGVGDPTIKLASFLPPKETMKNKIPVILLAFAIFICILIARKSQRNAKRFLDRREYFSVGL